MKNPFGKKRRIVRIKHHITKAIDCHQWASKLELQRLASSKPYTPAVPKEGSKVVE